jgi:hypothetical protein
VLKAGVQVFWTGCCYQDGYVGSAAPISPLNNLKNDEEELQGNQSINYTGLHRNMKHRGKLKRIVYIRLYGHYVSVPMCTKDGYVERKCEMDLFLLQDAVVRLVYMYASLVDSALYMLKSFGNIHQSAVNLSAFVSSRQSLHAFVIAARR